MPPLQTTEQGLEDPIQIINYMVTEWGEEGNEGMNKRANEQGTNEEAAICLPGAYGEDESCPYKHAPHIPALYQMDGRTKEGKMLKCYRILTL